jgi:acetyl esterase
MKKILSGLILLSIVLGGCNDSDSILPPEEILTHQYRVEKDITWASPEGFDLTLDIYIPETGKESYPVLIIFHGGSWLFNDKSVMQDMSEYLAQHSEYIICNVNYRLLSDNGNITKINEMIEDVFGAVLWVKDNISNYKGNPEKIAVTGDSAGGHLAAMVLLRGNNLTSYGFSNLPLGFNPTYLPAGKTAEDIASGNGITVQAGVFNYAPFDLYAVCLSGFESQANILWSLAGVEARGLFGDSINVKDNPEYYYAVSPIHNIPSSAEKKLPPQLCTVGSMDNVVSPASVRSYVDALQKAGQQVEYWEYKDKPHAYLNSGSNQFLGISFEKDAPEVLNKIISFLNSVL